MKNRIFIALLVFSLQAYGDGKYLGDLDSNPYNPNSVSNPYGQYGSKYSPDSINNQYGEYGSPYSNKSVNNPYATDAPKLIESGGRVRIIGDDGY